ncbi:conserved hypothetical protein [Dinoroseobacter shibae DFL 12 = DSM 16493]|jgi:hypothetical protein|uniref:DUF4167 domain-containing protein n=1 Tax=Dinoroseobacter shibae (strain DSM 16493 / NCIMB 14021 / DFL 12) TaxID=398580 RepID=A8LLU5_DINSH|nr:DUF4167 domain-containing protein [Dinoroseobacter shibae]ABV93473.1 conserved hypothetical protein [Dinoroseobacter shibae DFL 12 = DSM 16493]URF48383.1 DUF4167 domain-containing protein [Dinoroseobacter shibae]URF52693.1 DUF4167 domain-containing protein [Dinoroseobacter shibae]
MRSSKSRSRNKNNRRSVGNIVNRVFDSSGPEGKVRGTPQQIIDKYLTLARDAQLANDRVAVENFQQHAEHYTRMLSEAMREQEARQEQQAQQAQNQQKSRGDRNERGDRGQSGQGGQGGDQPSQGQSRSDPGDAPQPETAEAKPPETGASDVIDLGDGDTDTGLVETPESKPARKPRTRSRRKKTDEAPAETAEASSETPAAE